MDRIVEQQVGLWHERQARTAAVSSAAPHWPVVTVSREFGAAGARIAERLAELLGFAFWDRQVLEAIAEKLNSSVTDLDALDERTPGAMRELLAAVMRSADAPRREFHDALRQLVKTLERNGSAVIVGRGAGHIVDPALALRVRVTAPLEQRVASHARQEGIDLATARSRVLRADKERQAYIERHFNAKVEDPLHYDFVLNVGLIPFERAAEVLREVYRCKFQRVPPA